MSQWQDNCITETLFFKFPESTVINLECIWHTEYTRKHVSLSVISYNIIKWKKEVETIIFNNYLGKIFSFSLCQCKMCLHCVVSLWAIDICTRPFVQVMLIFVCLLSSHVFAKATGAVGEEVKPSAESDSADSYVNQQQNLKWFLSK